MKYEIIVCTSPIDLTVQERYDEELRELKEQMIDKKLPRPVFVSMLDKGLVYIHDSKRMVCRTDFFFYYDFSLTQTVHRMYDEIDDSLTRKDSQTT